MESLLHESVSVPVAPVQILLRVFTAWIAKNIDHLAQSERAKLQEQIAVYRRESSMFQCSRVYILLERGIFLKNYLA